MAAFTDKCRVCGREFRNSHERRLTHCSVGCSMGLPIDDEMDRRVTAALNDARGPTTGRKLVYWPDTLANNLREAGALCRSYRLACLCWPLKPKGETGWDPGCGRPAPGHEP